MQAVIFIVLESAVHPFCLGEEGGGFHMPWDNSVNKNGIIYADHTTLDVRNMPLTS